VERESNAGRGRSAAGGPGGRVLTAPEARPPAPDLDVRPDRLLRLIALFKFGKAVLATVVGLGALRLLQPSTADWADRWLSALAVKHDRRVLQHLLALVVGLPPRTLETLAVGAFLLAGLFAVEGVGLWLGKRWAEYLTVVATILFVPVEVVRLVQLASLTRLAALLINLAVVAYLMHRLVRRRRVRRQVTPPLYLPQTPA
jgi:uncharacterized membrane protein (DUF2068 family)